MKRLCVVWVMVLAFFMVFMHACGGGSDGGSTTSSANMVSGVAAAGAPILGQVTLRDKNGVERGPGNTDSSGNFSFDVTGLTPPFILKVAGKVGNDSFTLYSVTTGTGKVHINPFTHLLLAVATGLDPSQVFSSAGGIPDVSSISDAALQAALANIKTLLQPLLDDYGITDFDPLAGNYEANPGFRIDAMLDVIKVEVAGGTITITNKLDGSVMASGSVVNFTAISLDQAKAPDQASLTDIQKITTRVAELCLVMNLGAGLTVQVLDGFFIPDPQYGTSNGHTRTEDIASIPAIFGPGGTNTHGKLKSIRNVRLVRDITADYDASRGAARVYVLNYDFIHENGDIVTGTNVTFARETSSGQWKFIGDPDQNNGGDTSNYGGLFVTCGNSGFIDYILVYSEPVDVTSDGTNLYVVDSGNSTIKKIVISTGEVSTLAGSAGSAGSTDGIGTAARFNFPEGITTDGTNLYVTDAYSTIRKIVISTGEVTTFAGAAGIYGSDDGTGTSARFRGPRGITTDGTNLYIADSENNRIRQIIISTGAVTTLAGGGTSGGSGDGIGSAAEFNGPRGVTTDGTNLYVTDGVKDTVRKIVIATKAVTTLAGTPYTSGTADGIGSAARFTSPSGITTDGINLYVSDYSTIRKIVISTGAVTTLAGSPGQSGSVDGTGTSARFYGPRGIAAEGTSLYVADSGNNKIRKIVISTGAVTTI